MLVSMLKDTKEPTITQFLIKSFSRVSPAVARRICEAAGILICDPDDPGEPDDEQG